MPFKNTYRKKYMEGWYTNPKPKPKKILKKGGKKEEVSYIRHFSFDPNLVVPANILNVLFIVVGIFIALSWYDISDYRLWVSLIVVLGVGLGVLLYRP